MLGHSNRSASAQIAFPMVIQREGFRWCERWALRTYGDDMKIRFNKRNHHHSAEKNEYPPFLEKAVPAVLGIIVAIIIVLIWIILSVVLGLWPETIIQD